MPADTNPGISGAVQSVSRDLTSTIPPAFLVLVFLNIIFIGIVFWFEAKLAESRSVAISKLIDTCLADISKLSER